MAEFGWTVPCLVAADGELIAGHGRVLAAAQLGLAEAPVIVLDHLTEAQRRAYRIADNKLTEMGGWDEALLLEELRGLMAEDFDLGLIGIPEDELDALLHDADDDRAPIDDDTADAIPEAPAEPITRPGDIWALGRSPPDLRRCDRPGRGGAADGRRAGLADVHLATLCAAARLWRGEGEGRRLGCADAGRLCRGTGHCRCPAAGEPRPRPSRRRMDPLLGGLGRTGCARRAGGGSAGMCGIRGPAFPATGTDGWRRRTSSSSISTAPRKPHKTVPSKHAGETLGGGGLRGADGTVHRKTGFGNAIQSHRIPDSVFRIMRHKGGLGAAGSHPAVFPVALVEAVLEAFTDPGDLIYEPFCGSGTQLIAAERTGRRCCAVELDPVYCDVAVRRWEMATGRMASRVAEPTEAKSPAHGRKKRA
jgi:hypothetical protein